MSVGIDIGSKTIKIVELSKEGKVWRLRASGAVGYKGISPEYSKDDKELASVSEALKKLHKEAKISSKDVVISLPEQSVYTRTIKFPFLTDSEIASAVRWEAEQYIPIPASEAVIQHQVIEKRDDVSPPFVVVLLVAAPKELVASYAKVIDMAGLNLSAVETELISIVRSLAPIDQTVLILDLGAKSTNIAISKNQSLVFSRSISTAGEAFTRAISKGLGIEERQAEEYKKAYGLSQSHVEGKIKNALEPLIRIVADEIKKAIHYYQAEEKGETPSSVILSGGSSNIPEISSVFTKILGIEVLVGNPFSSIEVDQEAVKALSGYAPLYSIALGLAMREL